MKRPLAPVVLCAALAFAAPSVPAAAQSERPPKDLWEAFPLEPTVTASPAAPSATPSRVAPASESGGISTGILVALVMAAAGFGALATRIAAPDALSRSGEADTGPPAQPTRPGAQAEPAACPPPAVGAAPKLPAGPPAAVPSRPASAPRPRSEDRHRAPAPPARPAESNGFSPPVWDACRIRLHNREIRAHFFVVPYEGGPVIARSPYFKIRHVEGDPGLSARDALRALIDGLTAAGWRQTGAGREPWDLRFERGASAPQAASRR